MFSTLGQAVKSGSLADRFVCQLQFGFGTKMAFFAEWHKSTLLQQVQRMLHIVPIDIDQRFALLDVLQHPISHVCHSSFIDTSVIERLFRRT